MLGPYTPRMIRNLRARRLCKRRPNGAKLNVRELHLSIGEVLLHILRGARRNRARAARYTRLALRLARGEVRVKP